MDHASSSLILQWESIKIINPPSPPFRKVGTTRNRGGLGGFDFNIPYKPLYKLAQRIGDIVSRPQIVEGTSASSNSSSFRSESAPPFQEPSLCPSIQQFPISFAEYRFGRDLHPRSGQSGLLELPPGRHGQCKALSSLRNIFH